MAAVEKVAKYSKMVEAACGAAAMYGATLLDHKEMLPEGTVYWLNLAIGIFTVFRVWLVKNEKLIEDAVEAGEELYGDLRDAVRPEDTPTERIGRHEG